MPSCRSANQYNRLVPDDNVLCWLADLQLEYSVRMSSLCYTDASHHASGLFDTCVSPVMTHSVCVVYSTAYLLLVEVRLSLLVFMLYSRPSRLAICFSLPSLMSSCFPVEHRSPIMPGGVLFPAGVF